MYKKLFNYNNEVAKTNKTTYSVLKYILQLFSLIFIFILIMFIGLYFRPDIALKKEIITYYTFFFVLIFVAFSVYGKDKINALLTIYVIGKDDKLYFHKDNSKYEYITYSSLVGLGLFTPFNKWIGLLIAFIGLIYSFIKLNKLVKRVQNNDIKNNFEYIAEINSLKETNKNITIICTTFNVNDKGIKRNQRIVIPKFYNDIDLLKSHLMKVVDS